jgi:hypothetical protein
MDWGRWRQPLKILNELGTVDLLRKSVPSEQLYFVDRLLLLIAVIEKIGRSEEDRLLSLFGDD